MPSLKHETTTSKLHVADSASAPQQAEASQREELYKVTDQGLEWVRETSDGPQEVRLTNFHAEIVADVTIDDGLTVSREFEIEARTVAPTAPTVRFQITAGEFEGMKWPMNKIGANAIVAAGRGLRDHARAAIQHTSRRVLLRQKYGHTGWHKIDGEWIFLHAGGSIGANGASNKVEVVLPDTLAGYYLPTTRTFVETQAAIRATLNILKVAPHRITIPCVGAVFRAPLGDVNFSLHLEGQTGTGKSEMAALMQQHYGSSMDARHLPGNWSSTANSPEASAHAAKNCLLVVDDFLPLGGTNDVQHQHREADRLLRNQGNGAGRQRMNADSTLKPTKYPRGLILSTGEDTPRGHSLRARMFLLELAPNAMNWERLSLCQKAAARGRYALTMAGFLQWLAPRYESIQGTFRAELEAMRARTLSSASHRRTPEIVANLALAWKYFFSFAVDSGALTEEERQEYMELVWSALMEASSAQAQHHVVAEPATRFTELLVAALGNGSAHLASAIGEEPETNPKSLGWRQITVGTGDNQRIEWRPQGSRIGWVEGDNVYLNADAGYKAAQAIGRELGDSLTLTPQTLKKRLDERGLLASTDSQRGTLTIRRTLEGQRRAVLHLTVSTLFSEESR